MYFTVPSRSSDCTEIAPTGSLKYSCSSNASLVLEQCTSLSPSRLSDCTEIVPAGSSKSSSSGDESLGSPGTPSPTPSSGFPSPIRSNEHDIMGDRIEFLEMSNKRLCEKLKRAVKEANSYHEQLEKQEKTMNSVEKECERKILNSKFWKHKIYEEGTRGGKILKKALQNRYS